ncbi:MAG: hypothetical protein QE493_03290 [Verrucomicrobiae bacterium]|nr:hypothetical protein [Verrucomicrobiae bacterium]
MDAALDLHFDLGSMFNIQPCIKMLACLTPSAFEASSLRSL